MGRSSPFFENLLAALSPRSLFTARRIIEPIIAPFGAAMTAARDWPAAANARTCALTFQPSNHSFIQLFELQLPALAVRIVAMTCRRDHTRTAILERRRTALCRSRLRRRHAARHRRRRRRQSRGGELSFRLQGRIDRRIVRHPQPRHQPRAAQRIEGRRRSRRRTRRHRRHPARAGRADLARLPRPRQRALDRGALHDPRLDRIGAADPPHQESRNRSFAEIRRRDAPLAARPRSRSSSIGACISRWRWRTRPSATASG